MVMVAGMRGEGVVVDKRERWGDSRHHRQQLQQPSNTDLIAIMRVAQQGASTAYSTPIYKYKMLTILKEFIARGNEDWYIENIGRVGCRCVFAICRC